VAAATTPEEDEHTDASGLKIARAIERARALRFRVTTGVRAVGTALSLPAA